MENLVDLVESFRGDAKIALVYHNGYRTFQYTYAELLQLICKTAAFYLASDISPGDRIAIWGPNCPDWVIAYFGAIYVGAAVVPIDFSSRPEAVEGVLRHAGVKLLIKSQFRAPHLTNFKTAILEDLEFDIQGHEMASNPYRSTPEDIALIVYTSGTTGDPKGVMLSHRNIIADMRAIEGHISLSPQDTVLSVLPLSHMLEATCGLLVPLSQKMTIVYTRALTPTSIFRAFEKNRITIMIVVPRLLEGMRRSILARLDETRLGRVLKNQIPNASRWPRLIQNIIFDPIHRKFGRPLLLFVSGGAYLLQDTEECWNNLGFTTLQ